MNQNSKHNNPQGHQSAANAAGKEYFSKEDVMALLNAHGIKHIIPKQNSALMHQEHIVGRKSQTLVPNTFTQTSNSTPLETDRERAKSLRVDVRQRTIFSQVKKETGDHWGHSSCNR